VSESLFRAEGERYLPSEHTRGPWDPGALHGGAPAALITAAFQRMDPDPELRFARLGFEFLRPVPMAPLTLCTGVARGGRRVRELSAELRAEDQLVCRASALLVQRVPEGLPAQAHDAGEPMPGPELARRVHFSLDGDDRPGFGASATELRFLDGAGAPGPARVWMRLLRELYPGVPASPLAQLSAMADFGNGVSASLPIEQFVFINADLHIHLHREPSGAWTGLDSRTLLSAGGTALAESVLHDEQGSVGRAFQALVVARR